MPGWRTLTDAERSDVVSRIDAGEDEGGVAARYGMKAVSLARQMRRLRALGTFDEYIRGDVDDDNELAEEQEPALLQWERHRDDAVTWEELLEHAELGASLQNRMRPVITEASRTIDTNKPTLLVFMSDFHLGSRYTDYRAFIETTKIIKSDPRFNICIVGPDQETAFTWFHAADAVLNQTIPPYQQIELYRLWLDDMLDRTIAVTSDNHTDRRLEKGLGDIGLAWRTEVPYFRQWGILKLMVGKTEYRIVMSHKWRGSSIYHKLQPALRLMRDVDPTADIYVTAHTHQPAYMCGVFFPAVRQERPRQHFIVCGTFKTGNDVYSLGFGAGGVLGLPTLALWPNEYRIAAFDNPQTALLAMSAT